MPKADYRSELRCIVRFMIKIERWLALHPADDLERALLVEYDRLKSEVRHILQKIGEREANIVEWSVEGEIAASDLRLAELVAAQREIVWPKRSHFDAEMKKSPRSMRTAY